MSIQANKQGATPSPSFAHHDFFGPTEQNRQVLRTAVFGELRNYPALQKAESILDGDYNYNSGDLKYFNRGS